MKKINLVIVGSSGQAKVVIDIFEKMNNYEIVGLIDGYREKGAQTSGYDVLGSEDVLPELQQKYEHLQFFVAIGDNALREKVVLNLLNIIPTASFANAVHPSAQIAASVTLGQGVAIMAGAVINSDTSVGNFTIINTKASLDHDCVLGDYASLGPNATTGGNVKIGKSSVLGISATIKHNIKVGSNTIVGASALLLQNCADNEVWFGAPARFVKPRVLGEKYL